MKDRVSETIIIVLLVVIAIVSIANLSLQLADRNPAWPPPTEAPFNDPSTDTRISPSPSIANIRTFDECQNAGFPIMESYPRQCAVPGGATFTESLPQ